MACAVLFSLSACGGETEQPGGADVSTEVRQVSSHAMVAIGTVGFMHDLMVKTGQLIVSPDGWSEEALAELIVENPACSYEVSNSANVKVTAHDKCVSLANHLEFSGQVTTTLSWPPLRVTFEFEDMVAAGRPISGKVITTPADATVDLEFLDTGVTFSVDAMKVDSDETTTSVEGVPEMRRPQGLPFSLSLNNVSWGLGSCLPSSGEFAPVGDDAWRVFLTDETPGTGLADVMSDGAIVQTKLFSRCE